MLHTIHFGGNFPFRMPQLLGLYAGLLITGPGAQACPLAPERHQLRENRLSIMPTAKASWCLSISCVLSLSLCFFLCSRFLKSIF